MERKDREPRNLALIGSSMNFIDVAGAELLVQEAKRLRQDGRSLYLFRIKPGVKKFLERGGYMAEIGEEYFFDSKDTGLSAAISKLNHTRCETCTARVFSECPEVSVPVSDLAPEPA